MSTRFLFLCLTHQRQIDNELVALAGVLTPAGETDRLHRSGAYDGKVILYLGSNCVIASTFPIVISEHSNRPVLTLNREPDGELWIALDVIDESGKIVVRLDRDGFVVNKNNYLTMKRNDRSSLSVQDQRGVTVLNSRYINPLAFSLEAALRYPDGSLINISMEPRVQDICFDISGVNPKAVFSF